MKWSALGAALLTFAAAPLAGAPDAQAVPGDIHIYGVHETRTLDCQGGTLFINGVNITVHAFGDCWAVTMQGSQNTVIAENIINDVTVYGYDQTVYYKNGDPFLFDRGRELGMTNRLARVPA
ncbi:DUF3060 domain-containing protein [Mycolicibacter sinensis]|uniref:Transmembrane protein n=1 Tax=Mycolicibacter sinensis (strain JDM601) TaxID=875328 RepID=A0A1A3TSU7_MYCSD|nr:DUF3060 domain-containing protein [Mycolicibacter sinensis]MDD7811499.1 DUF3060 domain-containing protein [Mycobacterium sp. CSUR Q5927]OBK85720.1 hypothetical protein A5648_06760 [Mycolicibacter sinensis]